MIIALESRESLWNLNAHAVRTICIHRKHNRKSDFGHSEDSGSTHVQRWLIKLLVGTKIFDGKLPLFKERDAKSPCHSYIHVLHVCICIYSLQNVLFCPSQGDTPFKTKGRKSQTCARENPCAPFLVQVALTGCAKLERVPTNPLWPSKIIQRSVLRCVALRRVASLVASVMLLACSDRTSPLTMCANFAALCRCLSTNRIASSSYWAPPHTPPLSALTTWSVPKQRAFNRSIVQTPNIRDTELRNTTRSNSSGNGYIALVTAEQELNFP